VLELLLARSLSVYILVGLIIAFVTAMEMVQRREMVNKLIENPWDQVFALMMTVLIWPALLAEMVDQHKDGPWKG
jgi:hypothetical protein